MHIFDFRWETEKSEPYFQIHSGNILEKKYITIGEDFSLTITAAEKKCVGAFVNGQYRPCPTQATGVKKCETCKKAEDYFPCQFCNGFNCSRFRDVKIPNCDAEHMVYLALFEKDLVKVGVSGLSRGKARQYEQGSHFTRVLAQGMSGVMARRIETSIIRAGFPDKIPASKKKNILFPELSLEEGKAILQEKYDFAVDHLLSVMPEVKKFICSESIFWDMREFYSSLSDDMTKKFSLPFHILSLEEGESVGGELVMVKGSFLVIHTGNELAVVLAKDLVGKEVSFEECEKGIVKNGGFQGGLF